MPPDGAPRNWWGDLAGTEPGSVRKIATVSATVAIDKRRFSLSIALERSTGPSVTSGDAKAELGPQKRESSSGEPLAA